MLDPSTRAAAPAPIRNVGLRLGAHESDTRFFARQNELREAIDVLSGQSAARVLMVLGPAGVGKTLLLLRVLDEIAS